MPIQEWVTIISMPSPCIYYVVNDYCEHIRHSFYLWKEYPHQFKITAIEPYNRFQFPRCTSSRRADSNVGGNSMRSFKNYSNQAKRQVTAMSIKHREFAFRRNISTMFNGLQILFGVNCLNGSASRQWLHNYEIMFISISWKIISWEIISMIELFVLQSTIATDDFQAIW